MSDDIFRMWRVRAGQGKGIYLNQFLETNTVRIGWNELGDLTYVQRDFIRDLVAHQWPQNGSRTIGLDAGMLRRFRYDISVGDYVVTPDGFRREYLIGQVESDYRFEPDSSSNYSNFRDVVWISAVCKDAVLPESVRVLDTPSTIIEIPSEICDELLSFPRRIVR